MNKIKIKTPAKINLTLEILNKREDGFHNIKTIMQAISLYDYISITVSKSKSNSIILTGNTNDIPYNEQNIVYKAWKLFFECTKLQSFTTEVYIQKNIPISAGLAGGSSDAAGFLFGINEIFNNILTENQLHELCAKLGSDLNFCLEGGCALCTSRGEKIEKLPVDKTIKLNLIKPKGLGISAKEAYSKFSKLTPEKKIILNTTDKLKDLIKQGKFDKSYLINSLEIPLLEDYPILKQIKQIQSNSLMSGSGSTFFTFDEINKEFYTDEYEIFENLSFVKDGAVIVNDNE